MSLAVATLAVAVVVALLRGGRLRRIADSDLRWAGLLFLGVVLQVIVDLAAGRGVIGGGLTYAGLLASQIVVLAWVLGNRRQRGMALIGLGLLLNAVVMAANGAMPVDPDAVRALGVDTVAIAPGKHELLTSQTRLPWLADVLAVPPIRTVISVGDLVLATGIAVLVHHLMTRRPPRATTGAS